MILNQNQILSSSQAITATAISQNVINWGLTGVMYGDATNTLRDLGAGGEVPCLVQVVETFAGLTTLTITLETADDAALTTNAVVLASSAAIPVASLKAGYKPGGLRFMPSGTMKQYYGLRYTVGGTNATAGKITAAIAVEVQSA
ncbi:MAG: hypothetical protein JWQ44_2909 [Chthoniobacter sp.]|nr:hypothetical protein [Chthoniobacter sp.]